MSALGFIPGVGFAKALLVFVVETLAEWVDHKINSGHYARRKARLKARGCKGCKEAHQLMVDAPECPLPSICGEHAAWSRSVGRWAQSRGLAS